MMVFFNFQFDIIITYFLSPHFLFYLCDKHIVIISKIHYESIFFLEFIPILKYDFKSITKWTIKILMIIQMLNMVLHFKFMHNLENYSYPFNYIFILFNSHHDLKPNGVQTHYQEPHMPLQTITLFLEYSHNFLNMSFKKTLKIFKFFLILLY